MFFSKDSIQVKKEFGKYWLKIFYHNSKEGHWFSESEINEVYEVDKFSILGLVKDIKVNDYYEFLLQYPSVEGYNNWRQKVFPLDASQKNNDNIQYYIDETLHISWEHFWTGLSLSSKTEETIIDGCGDGNWWFTIGAKKTYLEYNNMFPGPIIPTQEFPVQEVYLWIRLPMRIIIPLLRCSYKFNSKTSMIFPFISIFIK